MVKFTGCISNSHADILFSGEIHLGSEKNSISYDVNLSATNVSILLSKLSFAYGNEVCMEPFFFCITSKRVG